MFHIVPFQNDDLEETIRCVSRVFTQKPLTQGSGIDEKSYIAFAQCFCKKAVEEQLSLIVKDKQSSEVIGFSILEDFVSDVPNLDRVDSRFIPIMNLLSKLDDWYKNNSQVKSGQILHIFMIGVDEKYRGNGIAKQLIEKIFNIAKKNNYKSIIMECTGAISQHIGSKYGFKELKEIEYKTYVYNGELVFKDIKNNPSCKLMIKTF